MTGAGAIARRYARALFMLGEEMGGASRLLDEIDELVEVILVVPELERVLFTPIHPRAERRGVVAELSRRLEHSDEARAVAMLLVDENRMPLLPAIRDALRGMVEEAAGRVRATVTSARPLETAEVEKLRQVLAQRLNQIVSVDTQVDEGLLGGAIVRVGGLLLDGSLRTQLDFLRGSLRRGSA